MKDQSFSEQTVGTKARKGQPFPLSASETKTGVQIARRLHNEFRGLLQELSLDERGASTLSRNLLIDRATCQRIVQAAAPAEAELETLVTLPGVEGMRQFVEAIAKRSSDQQWLAKIASIRAGIDRFESFIEEAGGSQRRLRERLAAGLVEPALSPSDLYLPSDDPKVRASLFAAAATVTGRSAAASVMACFARVDPSNPSQTQSARVHGIVGLVCRPHCIPVETGHTPVTTLQNETNTSETLGHEPLWGDTSGLLLGNFCSTPLPRITSHQSGTRTINVIDLPNREGPGDLFTAYRNLSPEPHPSTLKPATGDLWFLQHMASRKLLFDTYLHRDLARQCIPSIGVHLWTPDVTQHASARRWSTRFPGGPRLELLDAGLRNVVTPTYGRMPELIEEVFRRLEWPREEFVGYRCEVEYPLWRAGYCMSFDFSGTGSPQ